jgi:hypothetical protein
MAKLTRVKAFPWLGVVEVGLVLRGRWHSLSERDRTRLTTLARRSRGWPGNLSAKERAEVARLLGKIDSKGITRELAWLRKAGHMGGTVVNARGRWARRTAWLKRR